MTTIQEIYEKNLGRKDYTQVDAEQFNQAEKALAEKRLDVNNQHNVDLLDEFFQKNRQVPVTLENIYRVVEERKSAFIWLSQPEADWYWAARQNPDLANSLAAHLAANGGSPGLLQNQGDALFENLLLLFTELHSRREAATPQTIANAEDRIAHRPGKQLHRVPTPRRTEPTSQAAKEFDGVNPFSSTGLVRQRDGSFGKSPLDYKREADAAAAAANPQAEQQRLSAEEQTWKSMASELTRYGTHSQQEQVRRVFQQAVANGERYRQVYEACNKRVNDFKRRAAVSGTFR